MEWKEEQGKLVHTLHFESQTKLAEQLVKIAHLADLLNHHPDVDIRNAHEMTLRLWTHDRGCITTGDRQLAAQISSLLKDPI